MDDNLLEVISLKTSFNTLGGKVKAVDDVSFSLKRGSTVAIVGESGSGKSITAMSILGLLPKPHGFVESGEILFENKNLLKLSEEEMCKIRGNKIGVIFQEPMTSLNPVIKIKDQIGESLKIHHGLSKKEIEIRVNDLLEMVKISNPKKVMNQYPFELSGGMRQRVMIALSIACNPSLIIADEPTTALDVTIQAEILELLKDISLSTNAAIMIITHDLGVVAEMAREVIVMYAGKIVEKCSVMEFYREPKHPYSEGLINSRPDNCLDQRLYSIPGMVPNQHNMPKGCAFSPRCNKCMDICKEKMPPLIEVSSEHSVRCWIYSNA